MPTIDERVSALEDYMNYSKPRIDNISQTIPFLLGNIEELKKQFGPEGKVYQIGQSAETIKKEIDALKNNYSNLEGRIASSKYVGSSPKEEPTPSEPRRVAPVMRYHLPFIVPLQKLWDSIKALWRSLWIPGYSHNLIYHIYQKNRSWEDTTPGNIYPLIPINTETLRAITELGQTGIKYILRSNERFRRFIYERINTYLNNQIPDIEQEALKNLRGEQEALKKLGRGGIENIEKRIAEVTEIESPSFSPGELNDVLDDLIIGATDAAAGETFAKISKKINETYKKVVPGFSFSRAIEAQVWVGRLKGFYVDEHNGWVEPFVESFASHMPSLPFTYKEKREKRERGEQAGVPVGILAGAGGQPAYA